MHVSDRIGRRMKLHDLHLFMAVVQSGSMSRAAKALNTTQPAISRSIAALELAFGQRLLDRHPQGVEPTACGRALLDCGVMVFDDLRQGMKNIEFLVDPQAGELRIGCHPFLATSLVPAVIDRLSRRYPRVVFHVVATQTDLLHRDLAQRRIDFALAWKLGAFADGQLDFEHLYDDPQVVVVGARHRRAKQRQVTLADLADDLWSLPPADSVLGTIAMDAFRGESLALPRTTVFTLPVEARLALVETGRYVTMCPTSTLRFPATRTGIRVLPVRLRPLPVPIGVVTLKNRSVPPLARLFVTAAREITSARAR